MSIDRKMFDTASEDELRDASVPDIVLGFLIANADRAFEASEIADQNGLSKGSVSTALSRLKDRKLVEHKARYWAATSDEERLRCSTGYERATALLNEQFGEEDPDAWRARPSTDSHPSQEDTG